MAKKQTHRKAVTWAEKLANYAEKNNIKIPIVEKVAKGERSGTFKVEVGKGIMTRFRKIYDRNYTEFTNLSGVMRAAVYIGLSIMERLLLDKSYKPGLDRWAERDEYREQRQHIDLATMDFYQARKMYTDGIINFDQYNESKQKILSWLDNLGLRDVGEEKLRKIEANEKVSILAECKTHGGKRENG